MSVKHNAEFERAVRIEMLRAKAALERQHIAHQAQTMAMGLDPSRLLTNLLPGKTSAWVSRGLGLVTRYPYLLTTVLSNRRFKAVRWMSLAALAVGAWAMFSGGSSETTDD